MRIYRAEALPLLGEVTLCATEGGLCGLLLGPTEAARQRLARAFPDDELRPAPSSAPLLEAAFRQLREYLAGERTRFDLPLAPLGTPFQREVWAAVAGIPYGETRSYAEIAAAVGRPGACRAVGAANRANPLGIIVPCHRVVGANGRLTGYAWGLALKERLLALESGRNRELSVARRPDSGHLLG